MDHGPSCKTIKDLKEKQKKFFVSESVMKSLDLTSKARFIEKNYNAASSKFQQDCLFRQFYLKCIRKGKETILAKIILKNKDKDRGTLRLFI